MSRRGDKARDMYRSVLPSRNRKEAREGKARVRRQGRRGVRQALREGCVDRVEQIERRQQVETSQAVGWRRGGDKINHFCRWGRRRTAHLPSKDRVAALRGELDSDGPIAEHALEHFQHEAERSHLEDRRRRSKAWREQRTTKREAEGRPFVSEKVLRRRLRQVFALSHRELNSVLKPLVLSRCDSRSPCKQVEGSTACCGRPVIRVPNDLFCVARRLWRDGKRPQEDGASADEQVAAFLARKGR